MLHHNNLTEEDVYQYFYLRHYDLTLLDSFRDMSQQG